VESSGSLVGQAEQVAYKNPFSAECNVQIQTVDAVADVGAQLAAQFAAGNITFDVISGRTQTDIIQFADKGWLAKIDKSLIKVDPATIAPFGILDYALGGEIDALVLAYKGDKFKDTKPSSWADFFDTAKFPGPRMLNNWGNPDATFVQALLAAGVKQEALTPFDYDKAFAELDKVKKDLILYDSGASMVQHMLNGEAVMCQCTDGRVAQMNRAGGGMAFSYDGAILFPNYWAVVKGSPHEQLAQYFVASILDPARAATFTSVIGYPTASLDEVKFLPKDVADNLSTAPANIGKTFTYTQAQTDWIAAHFDEMTKKWNDWLQK
jgi:putative spermidine/putrescine transport system substrate-binding protein